jgi:hypothetical protein
MVCSIHRLIGMQMAASSQLDFTRQSFLKFLSPARIGLISLGIEDFTGDTRPL